MNRMHKAAASAVVLGMAVMMSGCIGAGADFGGVNRIHGQQAEVVVDTTKRYQTMEGCGGSLTESSAVLLMKMPPEQRHQTLVELFDRNQGIGLSYLRQAMGASDFRLSNYTYDDIDRDGEDWDLQHFSIARDKDYVIPALKEAMKVNPGIKIMASPWSPPAWMKTGRRLGGGSLRDEPRVLRTYAEYFVKFIRAYHAEGIEVDAITPQNEPFWTDMNMPSSSMDPDQEIALVKLIGKRFKEEGIKTKIVVFDHNWNNADYAIKVMSDPEANKFIDGSAFHAYGGNVAAQGKVHDAFPDKNVYFTEASTGVFAANFQANVMWDVENLMIGATRNWAKTVLMWNIALDEHGGPKALGGGPWCRGLLTVKSNLQVDRNEDFYALAHLSKFVAPGARRVEASAPNSVAFLNPDGGVVVIVSNRQGSKTFTIRCRDKVVKAELPGNSVATFTWNARGEAVKWWVTSGKKMKMEEQSEINQVAAEK